MPAVKRWTFLINLLGGAAVLGSYVLGFRTHPEAGTVLWGGVPPGIRPLYAAILIPSALWMPLTFVALKSSTLVILWMVRVVLAVVGLASLSLLIALLNVWPPRPLWAHGLAVAGSIAFCLQTTVLDAIVWSALFSL